MRHVRAEAVLCYVVHKVIRGLPLEPEYIYYVPIFWVYKPIVLVWVAIRSNSILVLRFGQIVGCKFVKIFFLRYFLWVNLILFHIPLYDLFHLY